MVCLHYSIPWQANEANHQAAETNIAASAELFKRMILTPSATLREGMKQLSDHKGLTGMVLVLSGDKVTYQDGPTFDANDEIENNIEEFWRLGYS
jgi:hypothetical protein